MSELLFETDWLASEPVFYNEGTGVASPEINAVVDFANAEIDAEGLAAYMGTGYSVFGRTPVRGVRFMPPSSRLWRGDDGRLRVEAVPLDLEARLAERHTDDEVLDLLQERVRSRELTARGDIVIPTSGGCDSRLLNLMIADPSRVRSFTFGATPRQRDSVEVARARALSSMLGTRWERIHLHPFHTHMDAWDEAFGPAMHAHGMYQMEFYRQVRARLRGGELVLSGLGGEWLQGKGDRDGVVPPINGPEDVRKLVWVKGMHADPSQLVLPYKGTLAEEYYESHKQLVQSRRGRIIEALRHRVMLLHYLLRLPSLYGLAPDAPFLDVDVALAMLTLPDTLRRKRQWVIDYLHSRGASLECVQGSNLYWLYWPVMRQQPLRPLDTSVLAELVRPSYVRWINNQLSVRGLVWEGYERLKDCPGFRRACYSLRCGQPRIKAYHAYMTLWPIQRLLEKREAAQREAKTGRSSRTREWSSVGA